MHICFVEIGYPRPTIGVVGGAGTYVKIFANQLAQKGYNISVICGRVKNNSTYYKDGDINVYPVIEYGPLHYYISKIPILNIFSKLVRYLETGFKIYRKLCIINYKNKISIGIIAFCFIQEIIDYLNRIFFDELYNVSFAVDLPLQLCSIGFYLSIFGILMAISSLRFNEKFEQFKYFLYSMSLMLIQFKN